MTPAEPVQRLEYEQATDITRVKWLAEQGWRLHSAVPCGGNVWYVMERPAVCRDRWSDSDEHAVCAGAPGHEGWHASAPWTDGEGKLHAGSTWAPARTVLFPDRPTHSDGSGDPVGDATDAQYQEARRAGHSPRCAAHVVRHTPCGCLIKTGALSL